MFSKLVGMIDSSSAVVLVAMFACMAAVIIVALSRRTRAIAETDFALAKIKAVQEHERSKYGLETDRLVRVETVQGEREFKMEQTKQNMLTSHAKDITPGRRSEG